MKTELEIKHELYRRALLYEQALKLIGLWCTPVVDPQKAIPYIRKILKDLQKDTGVLLMAELPDEDKRKGGCDPA